MKTTMAEMKIYWMGLTADETLRKKRLVNLKTQQEKVSRMKYGKKTRKKEESMKELWDSFKQPNEHASGVPKEWESGAGGKKSEEIKVKSFMTRQL